MRATEKMKVDIVIPVYNEEAELKRSIAKLTSFLSRNFKYKYNIVIADNASRDSTLKIAKSLSKNISNVTFIHLDKKGRGRALKKAWMNSKADVVSYMDVDLSTNLEHFIEIVDSIIHHNYDLGVGSRLRKGSVVERSLKRQILSVGYNLLLKMFFMHKFTDAQCGFKAIKRQVAQKLIPMTTDQNWFFDTELLLLAERYNYRVFEVPVKWVERKKSKVRIFKTIFEYLTSIVRMRLRFLIGFGLE